MREAVTVDDDGGPAERWLAPLGMLALTVWVSACWMAGVLVPFLLDDGRLVAVEVVGLGADAQGLYAADAGPWGRLVQVSGALAAAVGVPAALGAAAWSLWRLVRGWDGCSAAMRVVRSSTVVVAVATAVAVHSAWGRALTDWSLG